MAVMAASKNSRESVSSFDEESRLEALEKGVRKKQGVSQHCCNRTLSWCSWTGKYALCLASCLDRAEL